MVNKHLRIGTRGSKLALAQTGLVVAALKSANPGAQYEIVVIQTGGDRDQTQPLSSLGVGVFVKELEAALATGRIDMAVHSAKDMPTDVPQAFQIAALLIRADPRDVLVSRHPGGLAGLPNGAKVATGSARRRALLLHLRPDLAVVPIRGNVDTRLSRLAAQDGPDGVVLAAAGLERVGRLSEVSEFLDPEVFVPAVGQGALAIETRADDHAALRIASSVDYLPSRLAVTAERSFLAAFGGGCSLPVAAHAVVTGDTISINAFAAGNGGRDIVRTKVNGAASEAAQLGMRAAADLLARGADRLRQAEGGEGGRDADHD